MNPDCINTTRSVAAVENITSGDLPTLLFPSFGIDDEKPDRDEAERSAFVPPLDKRFKGVAYGMALAVGSVVHQLECVITFLVFCLIFPFLLPALAILALGKYAAERYISYTRFNCTPFGGDDAVWQQDRPNNRHIIHAVMHIEGTPDIDKLRKLISERLVYGRDENGERICPRLTRIIETRFRYFVWKEDDNFSIENHVLNWNGHEAKCLEHLEDVISDICSVPLPKGLPPWQFLVVPITEGNSFGLILRIHHSVADGVALTRVFVKNLYDVPPQGPEPKKFSTKQRFYMWCKALLVGPLMTVTKFFSRADNSKIHGRELSGKKLVAWSSNVDLSLVRRVKHVAGTTVNDVMVSCIAGALHDYLNDNTGKPITDDMWASVPVDIRASTKSVKLKNEFAIVFLRLPIVAKNAVDRLLATKQRMDFIKTSAEPFVTATIVQILMMLPDWFSKPLLDYFSKKVSCVLSNIPGPQHKLYLGGQRIIQGIFWPPQRANIGIGLAVFSYDGGIRVGVFSDESVIPDPKTVVKGFEKHFWELVNELNISDSQ